MSAPISPTTLTLLVLAPFFGWRIYRRFRKLVGRQRFSAVRSSTTLVVYSLLVIALGIAAWPHPARLGWLVGGIISGSLLGVFGLKKTRFEPTPNGLFYTPQAHLGIALSLLFVARIIFRLIELAAFKPAVQTQPVNFAASVLTLAVLGLLAGYYVTYAIGLIRWRFQVIQPEALKLQETPPGA